MPHLSGLGLEARLLRDRSASCHASNISLAQDSSFCVVQMSDAMFCHGALLVLV